MIPFRSPNKFFLKPQRTPDQKHEKFRSEAKNYSVQKPKRFSIESLQEMFSGAQNNPVKRTKGFGSEAQKNSIRKAEIIPFKNPKGFSLKFKKTIFGSPKEFQIGSTKNPFEAKNYSVQKPKRIISRIPKVFGLKNQKNSFKEPKIIPFKSLELFHTEAQKNLVRFKIFSSKLNMISFRNPKKIQSEAQHYSVRICKKKSFR